MGDPGEIKRLDEDVINRIAAGEIIQRPANALKELIENSLDAKSTNIQVTVKNGGLKLLQIQDNGTGIRKEDFSIVCERFTTSKLREFEDLRSISTYGFRGEALASISHIAHLCIISKTKSDLCAFQANFVDGKLQGNPKPTAGNQGTIITVEDLFYNMHVRKTALRSPAEEYQKISEVVSKYAIHNSGIGFSLKKFGESNDIRTPYKAGFIDNIRTIYGNTIARELVEFTYENDQLKFKSHGFITNVNYSTKKFQFLLFINHRLVDCQSLKKCVDNIYATYLPKNTHPFVYLSLQLDPSTMDVNVHPTKHEVHFLNEEQIVESLCSALETKLLGSNNSRVFYTNAKLPGVQVETFELKDKSVNKTIQPKDYVRTDSSIQKLEKFFGTTRKKPAETEAKINKDVSLTEEEFNKHHENFLARNEDLESKMNEKTAQEEEIEGFIEDSPIVESEEKVIVVEDKKMKEIEEQISDVVSPIVESAVVADEKMEEIEYPKIKESIAKISRVDTRLTSVLELRKEIEENCHKILRDTFAQHVFVGAVDPKQSLIQYSTKLYLCNTEKILRELFYQFILYNFENFDCITFENPLSIYDLAMIGLDMPETGWTEDDGPKEELAQKITNILKEKSEMLLDYFSLEIGENGCLKSLPILVEDYVPDMAGLPMYVIRLATEVDWETEKQCFLSFARETAVYYANIAEESQSGSKDWKWVTEYVLYPAIKDYFMPPKSFLKNAAILEIANLPNLYKVFERC